MFYLVISLQAVLYTQMSAARGFDAKGRSKPQQVSKRQAFSRTMNSSAAEAPGTEIHRGVMVTRSWLHLSMGWKRSYDCELSI